MIENAANDLGPHALPLICPVDDHIPDRCSVDKVCEYSTESDEPISIPSIEGKVGMAEHFLRIIERSTLGPWSLVKQPKELRCVRGSIMRVGDG